MIDLCENLNDLAFRISVVNLPGVRDDIRSTIAPLDKRLRMRQLWLRRESNETDGRLIEAFPVL